MQRKRATPRTVWLRWGLVLGVFLLTSRSPARPAQSEGTPRPDSGPPPPVLVLDLQGGIFAGTADYLITNIERAERVGSPVLIKMDTPGGALDATRDIVKAFLGARVPVLVWVGPAGARAGSAGVFITMASHIAAMAPGTNIGAAHPVGLGIGAPSHEEGDEDRRSLDDKEVMAKKVENDTLAFIESIAKFRHRNVEWALSAVRDSVSITSDVAVEKNVVDMLARSPEAFLEAIDGRTVETSDGPYRLRTRGALVQEVPMTLRQRTLAFLGNPNLVYVLFVIGMLGIYLEMSHPGAIVPAVVGGVSIILALTGLSVLPYNASGLIFLILAGVCFVAEAYVSSFGLLSAAGAASLILGAILLFDTPEDLGEFGALQVSVSPSVYITVAVMSLALVLPVAYLVARAHLRKPVSGREGLVGEEGEAIRDIGPRSGRVFLHGEYWEARSTDPIPAGTRVVVESMDGLVLRVVPKPELEGRSPR